jgi:hypothetical protein
MRGLRARVLTTACACAVLALPAQAHAAQQVSYPAVLQQVKSGPLIRAVLNRRLRHIEIKFRNLAEWEASYPAGDQPLLQRLLRERHIRVIFASSHKRTHRAAAVHHHLRYIAAGAAGALALLAIVWALLRRRRAGAPPAGTAEDAPA